MKSASIAALVLLAGAAVPIAQPQQTLPMNTIAERYVKLVLALGQHDADYVDAFYGPPEWKAEAERQKLPLIEIRASAERLAADLSRFKTESNDELPVLRHAYLRRQLDALVSRVRMLEGATLTFDEESQALYDAVAPVHPDSYFDATLKEIDRAFPGEGPLIERDEAFRRKLSSLPTG